MVKNYNEYLKLLEAAVIRNGRCELSGNQIDDFIRVNNLNSDWGIVSSEVKEDMATVLKKYQTPVRNTPNHNTPVGKPNNFYNRGRSNSIVNKQVQSYDAYMRLLEDAVLKNSRIELSDAQIHQFLSANKLDSEWKITAGEVRKDMKTITAKLARQERTAALRAKYAGAQPWVSTDKSRNDTKHVLDIPNHKKSGLTEADKGIVILLKDMLKQYPDITTDKKRLKSAIADILPGKRKEINLLGTLADENIIQAIDATDTLDQVLCDRFTLILDEEFGTPKELARRMVLIWFHAYGRLIKNKEVD